MAKGKKGKKEDSDDSDDDDSDDDEDSDEEEVNRSVGCTLEVSQMAKLLIHEYGGRYFTSNSTRCQIVGREPNPSFFTEFKIFTVQNESGCKAD